MTTVAVQQQSGPNRSRSERKRTSKTLAAICELVKNGLSVSHAAQKLLVHHTTVGRWREDPEFDAAILAAEAEFIEGQLATIRTAAKTSWQASAWLLERKFPAFFSQPQVQFNMPAPKNESEDLDKILERLRRSPEARRIAPGLFDDWAIDVPALPIPQPEREKADGPA